MGKKLSRFLALVLRHKPEVIGIKLDKHGWAKMSELIIGIRNSGRAISREQLEELVRNCDKQRFVISEDGRLIRANQGHSIDIDLQLKASKPPDILFHGTIGSFMGDIWSNGIIPMSRQYVHLSTDEQTALQISNRRRGKAVIISVDALSMYKEGFDFYCSDNGVWLVHFVPSEFITVKYQE